MTKEEAERLGLFTAWQVLTCQNCDQYTEITKLEMFGSIIVCEKCLPKLKKAEQERNAHPTLFDGRLF